MEAKYLHPLLILERHRIPYSIAARGRLGTPEEDNGTVQHGCSALNSDECCLPVTCHGQPSQAQYMWRSKPLLITVF